MELKCFHIWATLLLQITFTYACRKSSEAATVSPTTTAPELSSAAKLLGTEQTTDRTTTSDRSRGVWLDELEDETTSTTSTTTSRTSQSTTPVSTTPKETTTINPLLRNDNRCGSAFPLENGSPAQCDPYGDNYCCSKWGFCGFTSEHCDCSDCINFRKEKSVNITEVTTKANKNTKIRSDGRCGSSVPLDDGSPAQCDPNTEYFCCSKWGYCGSTDEHCDCADCVNYRKDGASDKKKKNIVESSNTPSDEDYEGDFTGDYENVEQRSTTTRSRKKPNRSRLEVMKIKSTTERNIDEAEEEENVRDPIRIHNPLSIVSKSVSIGGKPTRPRNKPKKRQRNKSSNQRKKQMSGDTCRDTEIWCKYEPNCDKKDVQEKCPKFCKICKECKDLESWCKYEPKCDTEDVQKKCPKWCGTCDGLSGNQQESRTTLDDLDFDYDHSDETYSDGCNKRIKKWSGWRGGLDGKIIVKRKVDPAMPTWSLVMALDNDVKRLWSEDMSTEKMNNRTYKVKPAYSWNSEVEENEEKVINVHVRWDEEQQSPKIRTLLINGLSFECTGDNDYDTSSSIERKAPRKIRVRPKGITKEKEQDEKEAIEVITASNPDAIKNKSSRDPTRTRRVKNKSKSKSTVKTSTSVSFSTSSSSGDSKGSQSKNSGKRLSIPKLGGERGIFAKWPKKVMAFYVLLADDTEKGYESDRDWHPKLYPYMQTGANVLLFTFIHPETMEVPPAFANLAKTRGTDEEGAVPKDTVILFALGGYAYSVKVNPWPWLTSREAAEEMAERVAEWPEKYGCDGIDLDIEDGAGDAKGAGKNMIHFVRKLKQLQPKMIIGQPTYGYPAIHAEIDVINESWDENGNNNNLTDTIGLMVYEGTNSLNYVKNYVSGTKQWQGFPIKVNAPSNVILLGTKGKTNVDTIKKLVKEAIRKDYLGVMVWYASVIDGLQYAKGSWDASVSTAVQEAYIDGMEKFREAMDES